MSEKHLSKFKSKRHSDVQTKLHFGVIQFMFEAGTKLRMTSLPLATAATLYHKFFWECSPSDFDPHTIASCILYLAGKVEEEHVRLTDVVNVTHRILHPDKPALEIGSLYTALRDSLVRCELFVSRVLRFQFAVDHPHKVWLQIYYLVHYMKSLYDWLDRDVTNEIPIATTAWALLNDSYHGTLCISHRPDVIAVSVLYLALQCFGVVVPPRDDENRKYQWWEALIDDIRLADIKLIITELLNLYEFETTVSSTSLNVTKSIR